MPRMIVVLRSVMESSNGLGWKGPSRSSSPTPVLWAGTRLLGAPRSTKTLSNPGMGHPQPLWAACASAFTLTVKHLFLISNRNLPSFTRKHSPRILSLPSPAFRQPSKASLRSPPSLLFRLNTPNSLPWPRSRGAPARSSFPGPSVLGRCNENKLRCRSASPVTVFHAVF